MIRDCSVNDASIRAYNFVLYFSVDRHGQVKSEVVAIDSFGEDNPSGVNPSLGAQDARYFEWGAAIYLIFNAAIKTESGRHIRAMHIQRLFPSLTGPVLLSGLQNQGDIEKNWSPIGPHTDSTGRVNGDYLFSRFVDPHEILRCNAVGACVVAATTNHSIFFNRFVKTHLIDKLHLGTNAVRVSEQYYGAIFHGVQYHPTAGLIRNYMDFPYLFDAQPPYEIRYVASKPLVLPVENPNRQFAYSTGLSFIDGRLVVSYGVNDKSCNFFVDDVDSIFDLEHMVRVYE